MFKRLTTTAKKFLADEKGAEGIEKLLIIGAIVLPLLAVLFWFKDDITGWVNGLWGEVKAENTSWDPDNAVN